VFDMYVELHCHSAFSFLDGASQPDELVAAAAELGYEALALTDHNGVYGSMEHAQACAGMGVRAIHGAEIDLDDGRHITLLVEDARGWRNLCRILTRAHAHTRNSARRIATAPSIPLEVVLEHAEGLVCLSGCARQGVRDEPTMRRLLGAFGPDHLRIELQRPFARHDRTLNRGLASLAGRLGVPTVATGNVHAHSHERALLQDAFVAIREHTTLDASEPLRRGNFSHVLASPVAMASRFEDHPEAVKETLRLAERLRFDLSSDLGYRYPGSEDEMADRKLAEICWARFDDRYPAGMARRAEAVARLEEELKVIGGLNLAGFFLLHRDMLELAREVAAEVRGPDTVRALLPPGRGRGSSVSSIVCYLTGLSHIDPIENDLFLGRFLNTELTALPDIDLDFPRDIREVLIPRVHDRYGRDRAALVAAFPTYRSRGAVREIGKALGLPPGEIERVARVAEPWADAVDEDIAFALGQAADDGGPSPPGPPPWTAAAGAAVLAVATSREGGPDAALAPVEAFIGGREGMHDAFGDDRSFAYRQAATEKGWEASMSGERPSSAPELGGRWGWLARLAAMAYGLPRHLSQHPGGMIVSTRPLIDCVPLVPAAMEGRQMCHWDKDSCSDAGFLKIDLLGLGMLSAVERAVVEIERTRGERIDLSRIPFDDKPTYDAIQVADTMGVFQIESRAQMQSLLRTKPATLEDITIQVAIVRPGPIVGGAVNPYIQRKQALRENPDFVVPYQHPSLEPVLKETLGTIIFQDQVLEVAMAFAGFSPGEAEGLRRAMSRKRSAAAIQAYHDRFVEGAARTHGADQETAEEIFTMIAGFSGFGFPKAHGAAFGLLAYQSTWLRVHYKPEFTCALLNEQPMGFYPSDTLVHEAQRTGIAVHPPAVNESRVLCHVEASAPPAIRIGLAYLSGARKEEMEAVVAEREARGPYRSLGDLASRAGIGRPSLEVLAWSGACDALLGASSDQARRTALWQLGIAAPAHRRDEGAQLALPLELPDAPQLRPLDPWEAMVADYATTGLTAGPHPFALLRGDLPEGSVTSRDLDRLRHGTPVRTGGLVVARQRPATANGIVFLLLEDEFGTINLVVPPPVYERDRLIVRGEPLVLVEGRLEKHPAAEGAINVVVSRLRPADRAAGEAAEVVSLPIVSLGNVTPEEWELAMQARRAAGGGGFTEVAPAVQSFGSGRRR
jgi:error-prone DNA polymerase